MATGRQHRQAGSHRTAAGSREIPAPLSPPASSCLCLSASSLAPFDCLQRPGWPHLRAFLRVVHESAGAGGARADRVHVDVVRLHMHGVFVRWS